MIAIIPKNLAKPGYKFKFIGTINECNKCNLLNVCKNIEKEKVYEVKDIKDKSFECIISGTAIVCEIFETVIETTVDKRNAYEGAKISLEKESCLEISCENFIICNNILHGKFVVKRILKDVDCKKGLNLVKVLLK